MLRSINQLYDSTIEAFDGHVGHAGDFYFDDAGWAIRYMIANTGSWLTGSQVLIAPHLIGSLDRSDRRIPVSLTRRQIELSPSIETHKPVSRQYEETLYRYYGLPYYWQGNGLWGMTDIPILVVQPPLIPGEAALGDPAPRPQAEVHLRSARSVVGHRIRASDGDIGVVADIMIDDRTWSLSQMVVETGHWYAGKHVGIAVTDITRISYEETAIHVGLSMADIELTTRNDVAHAGTSTD